MTTLPLAWIVSILTSIAAFALSQDTRIPFIARFFFCIFLLTLAAAGLLLGLRLSFDTRWAAQLQPLVAVMIAPSAYLGFDALTQNGASEWRKPLLVNGVPVVLAQVMIMSDLPVSADVFVLGFTSTYLFRVARLLPCNADDFVHVAPHALRILRSAVYATIFLLGMMVASDLLVVAASVLAGDAIVLRFLTGLSGVFTAFIFVVALVGAPMLLRSTRSSFASPESATHSDRALLAKLDAIMNDQNIYTDSNLTLARVARRLSVPVRDVSVAINRVTGENFSRYINGFRIRHAQDALRATELPITEVMFDAGFISKSSFNTEFRRITGQTPSQYRSGRAND
ncbi:AraC family transcriptional regulator [Stappia sp. BW2]|uniref:helix-turn-helix domain-containing protein n=1 Tax=Stappia sp. BW2 TaxID=2592622 RepID=UPI0025704659|nr:AraC family transcriptional regulator [Stappia sp. BW2]